MCNTWHIFMFMAFKHQCPKQINSNQHYYRFSRHCGILTLFYRAFFNGLRASNESSGPKVTFEPAKLCFKWKRPDCLFKLYVFHINAIIFIFVGVLLGTYLIYDEKITTSLNMAILSWRINCKIHKRYVKFRSDLDGSRTWVAKR